MMYLPVRWSILKSVQETSSQVRSSQTNDGSSGMKMKMKEVLTCDLCF